MGKLIRNIIIDPGHGGKDNGGGTLRKYNIKEKDVALKISLYMKERLEQHGFKVSLTRDKDMYLYSTPRMKKVRYSGADLCISNHINAYNKKSEGFEAIHSMYNDGVLANKIANEIKLAGQKVRRVFTRTFTRQGRKRDYYYVNRLSGNVMSLILEYGFGDNDEDATRIYDNWKKYVDSAVKAICEYSGIKYLPVKEDIKEEVKPIKNTKISSYKKIGSTHIIKIHKDNWDKFKLSKCMTNANKFNSKNCCTAGFQWTQQKMPLSLSVEDCGKEIFINRQPHYAPSGTIAITKNNEIVGKRMLDARDLPPYTRFCVGGYTLYPLDTVTKYMNENYKTKMVVKNGMDVENFKPPYNDVFRRADRIVLGYKGDEIYIIFRPYSTVGRLYETCENLDMDYAICLDGGGSTKLSDSNVGKIIDTSRFLCFMLTWD